MSHPALTMPFAPVQKSELNKGGIEPDECHEKFASPTAKEAQLAFLRSKADDIRRQALKMAKTLNATGEAALPAQGESPSPLSNRSHTPS